MGHSDGGGVSALGLRVYVALASLQVETLVAFYATLLGQNPQIHWPQRYAEFNPVGLRLAIFRPQASQAAEFATHRPGSMSLCLEVADLDAAMTQMIHLGYPPPGPILTVSHGREIYAYDPDGHRLILHQSLPRLTGRERGIGGEM